MPQAPRAYILAQLSMAQNLQPIYRKMNSATAQIRPASIVALCNGVVEALQSRPLPSLDESVRAENLSLDVQMCLKYYVLFKQRQISQPPHTKLEQDHSESVTRLADRCRTILSLLYDFLRSTAPDDPLSDYKAEARQLLTAETCATFRSHLTVHTKVSQLTINVLDLSKALHVAPFDNLSHTPHSVYQWKQNARQHDIYSLRQSTSHSLQELKKYLGLARDLVNGKLHISNADANGLRSDVTRCLESVESIVQVTRIRGFADFQDEKRSLPEGTSSAPTIPSNAVDMTSLRRFEHRPKERQFLDPFDDDEEKVQDSVESEYSDPEPDFQENLPPAVYTELIRTQNEEVQRAMSVSDWPKAEKAHQQAMKYLEDRETQLGIPFDNECQMQETLIEILTKSQQYDRAKSILNHLLKQEKTESNRKWRLYHTLSTVYVAQNRLADAEKFAKRAYIGREKTLGKGHMLISESANLLILIYDRMGNTSTAQVFRNLHPHSISHPSASANATSPSMCTTSNLPTAPQIFKHVGTKRVPWTPDLSVDMNALTKSGKTPLINAIISGDDDFVHQTLTNGADVETRGSQSITPLMHAIITSQAKIAGVLLSRGAAVDSLTAGWTALAKAADMGHGALVDLLLENGADIDARSPQKFRPKAANHSSKHDRNASQATTTGSASSSNPSDTDASSTSGRGGWTPLLRAAEKGQEGIVRLLLDRGADIEAGNPTSRTALACATENQHEAVVDLLLSRGADVDAEDEFGWRALHLASFHHGGEGVALSLLNGGAVHRDSVVSATTSPPPPPYSAFARPGALPEANPVTTSPSPAPATAKSAKASPTPQTTTANPRCTTPSSATTFL
ncbi:uncharacterized protein KY384_008820 [Bacidia gigantensis]|uniref:uncharacterized protein n=1 Tax=Bacidia gigantensis TaxID=2732470 RepID=UPI001D047C8F|nr:uncharacterized protein KY384_008820 [Bacidia gigantensis]KAG8526619.1 hypothetical protein KY384_008820 [Bacidia gigantensis]